MTWSVKRYYMKAALDADLPKLLALSRKVLEFGGSDVNETNIYNVIAAGMSDVWGGWIDDRLTSVAVCTVKDRGSLPPCYLVYLLASERPMPKEMYAHGLDEMRARAKQLGCVEMEMYTKRERGFSRILEPFGWKSAYTVFTTEV